MDTKDLNIKGGILIIGSLLWQDSLDPAKGDNIRKLWRESRTLLNHKIMVKLPIRYGRLSKSDIYTMTFSNACIKSKLGSGYFVPLSKNPITSYSDLFNESVELSVSEGMGGDFLKRDGDKNPWCILGLLVNPERVSKEIQVNVFEKWKTRISNHGDFDPKNFKVSREKPCIDEYGRLNIDWPKPVDERDNTFLNGFDFLIATVTKPTAYPTNKELSLKVKSDKKRFYFIENYKSGITTFQDIPIINSL